MTVYKITSINDQRDILDFDPYSLYKSLKGKSNISETEFMIKIFDLHANNDSIKDLWPDILPITPLSTSYNEIDMYIQGGFLVLSKEASTYLKEFLSEYGEFLKIEVNGLEMALFNLHVFGKEDPEQCIEDHSKGVRNGFKQFSFVEADIKNKMLFKSRLLDGIGLFCGEKLKQLIELKKFNGIEFTTLK